LTPEELAEFAKRCQDGERAAFETVFTETVGWVHAIVAGIVVDEELSRECVQDIYLIVWSKIRFLRDPMTFAAWLKRIAVNRALRCAEQQKRRRSHTTSKPVEEALQSVASASASPAGEVSCRDILMRALAALNPKERSVLTVRELEGASYEELARLFVVPVGTIRSRLNSARKKVLSYFKDEEKQA